MSLTTITYLVFLLLCLIIFRLAPIKYSNLVLMLASIAFYLYAMPKQALIMMVYVLVIFFVGIYLEKAKKADAKSAAMLGILISLGFLYVYKYLNFTLSLFTGNNRTFSLVVPIGISYVTFSCISYLVEIKKGTIRALKNPVNFFLYTLFFAKLTAGPIEPPAKFFESVKKKGKGTYKASLYGISMIAMGFAKKLVIADLAGRGANIVFDSSINYDGLTTIVAIILYSVQIYFDFSGYTDIARGSAFLFGINLTENFNKPYSATSVRDFWKRWHISLSNWLKNYIYIPLGGSRVSTGRRYFNIFATFFVSGIWHGAAFTFIFWGALHGLYQMLEILLTPFTDGLVKNLGLTKESKPVIYLSRIRTYICVAFAWVFFRATSLKEAFRVIRNVFRGFVSPVKALNNCLLDWKTLVLMLVTYGLLVAMKKLCAAKKITRERTIACCVVFIWAVMLASLLGVGSPGGSSFIYFDF